MPYELARVAASYLMNNAEDIRHLVVESDAPALPGQFYMLRCEHSAVLLPRPISVFDRGEGRLHFVLRSVGEGTRELFRLKTGDKVALQGPLGNGWPLDELGGKRVALVGGGVGIPPLRFAAKALAQRGHRADCYLGYAQGAFLLDTFAGIAARRYTSSETLEKPFKGYITQRLEKNITRYDAVLCCGPTPMMKAAVELCKRAEVPVWVSMENRMACGIGACLVCTCADKQGHNRRTCKDGPVFRGEEIDFDA